MKKINNLLLIGITFIVFALPYSCFAQVEKTPVSEATETVRLNPTAYAEPYADIAVQSVPEKNSLEFDIVEFLVPFVAKFPWLASVIAVIGVSRGIAKPVLDTIYAVVRKTKTTRDDNFLISSTESWWGKVAWYVISLLFSVKPPPPVK